MCMCVCIKTLMEDTRTIISLSDNNYYYYHALIIPYVFVWWSQIGTVDSSYC